jgi:uncharacterized protein Usg
MQADRRQGINSKTCGSANSAQPVHVVALSCRSATVAAARAGGQAMKTHELVRQLTDWRQTTAEILYRMPDHPALFQTFVWQDMDRWHDDPRLTYPRLRKFCDWWNANLDGPIVEVRVGATQVVAAGELRHVDTELRLH